VIAEHTDVVVSTDTLESWLHDAVRTWVWPAITQIFARHAEYADATLGGLGRDAMRDAVLAEAPQTDARQLTATQICPKIPDDVFQRQIALLLQRHVDEVREDISRTMGPLSSNLHNTRMRLKKIEEENKQLEEANRVLCKDISVLRGPGVLPRILDPCDGLRGDPAPQTLVHVRDSARRVTTLPGEQHVANTQQYPVAQAGQTTTCKPEAAACCTASSPTPARASIKTSIHTLSSCHAWSRYVRRFSVVSL
tara:strand:- start:2933 stop:3688 length:756 start_codon:yes stop_codon:yes gene_type:complete